MNDQTRFNIQLELDHADQDPAPIMALLNSIPGVIERAQKGLSQVREGRGIPLSEF